MISFNLDPRQDFQVQIGITNPNGFWINRLHLLLDQYTSHIPGLTDSTHSWTLQPSYLATWSTMTPGPTEYTCIWTFHTPGFIESKDWDSWMFYTFQVNCYHHVLCSCVQKHEVSYFPSIGFFNFSLTWFEDQRG